MSMTRKHYNMIVDAKNETVEALLARYKATLDECQLAQLVFAEFAKALVPYLQDDNPTFDVEKFMAAMRGWP